jgi:hypothetical protein
MGEIEGRDIGGEMVKNIQRVEIERKRQRKRN